MAGISKSLISKWEETAAKGRLSVVLEKLRAWGDESEVAETNDAKPPPAVAAAEIPDQQDPQAWTDRRLEVVENLWARGSPLRARPSAWSN